MLSDGKSYGDITREMVVAASTVAYHARKMGIVKKPGGNRYNWIKIQEHIDNGGDCKSCIDIFNITNSAINYAISHGLVDIPKEKQLKREKNGVNKIPLEEILVENSSYNTSLKKRVMKENILDYHCYIKSCIFHNADTLMWCGEPIVLHLDHINGIRNDNRIENLRFLCPNCHSQTKTYCGRNK